MTGVQIKLAAEAYVDEFIDDPDALKAINEAIAEIGDMALIDEDIIMIVDVSREWKELPEKVTTVVEVEDIIRNTYRGYRVRGNNLISFNEAGTYKVYYRRIPKPISGLNETPEIHEAYHQALVSFLIGWWKMKDNDDNPDGPRNIERFKEKSMRVFNSLRRRRTPQQIQVVR
jgi:hypothetical protein